MSELTQEQINELRERLRQRHAEIREQIRAELLETDEQNYSELAGKVHDEAEESVADLLVDVSLKRIDLQVAEIRDIEEALQRIPEGSYGICEECGEAISFQRLQVRPSAHRCIECQQRFERTQEHHATI